MLLRGKYHKDNCMYIHGIDMNNEDVQGEQTDEQELIDSKNMAKVLEGFVKPFSSKNKQSRGRGDYSTDESRVQKNVS